MKRTLLRPLFLSASMFLYACSGASQSVGTAPADAGQTSSGEPGSPADAEEGSTARAPSEKDAGPSEQPSGPVTIKNLSMSPTNGGFTLTFALANTSTANVERVQEIALQVGTGKAITYALECQNPSWMVAGGDATGVLEIDVTTDSTYSRLDHAPNCGSAFGPTLPASAKSVTLGLKGLLDDAAPWNASAQTSP